MVSTPSARKASKTACPPESVVAAPSVPTILLGELIMEEIEAINFLFLFQLLKLKAVTNVAAFLFAAIGTRMIRVRTI